MSQPILVAILGLLLFISSLLGGGQVPSDTPGWNPPASSINTIGSVKSTATLRKGPGTNHEHITTLEPGTQLQIISEEQGWYEVRIPTGETGWISSMFVEIVTGRKPGSYEIIGFYMQTADGSSRSSLNQHYQQMTTVIPWAFAVTADGRVVNATDSAKLGEVLKDAGTKMNLNVFALISNYDTVNHQFSQSIASSVLKTAESRQRAIQNIVQTAVNWGVGGVNIDFENVPPAYRDHYTAFIRDLSKELDKKGLLTTVSIPAKTYDDKSSAWSGAYDYAAIGQYADLVILMAYDEHWAGGHPGPVASAGWVERVVKYAVTQIPKDKIILGVPAYGYTWSGPGKGSSVTYQKAVELAGQFGGVRWDDVSKTPYAIDNKGRELWFENAASLRYKLKIVTEYGVKGIAMWRLGQEDQNSWQVIRSMLGA